MGILNCNMKAFFIEIFCVCIGAILKYSCNIQYTLFVLVVLLEHIASLDAPVHVYKKAEA